MSIYIGGQIFNSTEPFKPQQNERPNESRRIVDEDTVPNLMPRICIQTENQILLLVMKLGILL